jgi:alkanesulfonate monooxygenase SsuD/methylene tetrahydromethanopterin reductase-like flavin-dependent oxidoreductase (luciferase family)
MRVGLALPHYDFSFPDGGSHSEGRATVRDVVAYAQRAEALGFDEVWVSDHLFFDLSKYGGPARRFGTPECFTMLTAIAAGTSQVRFGSLVLNVSLRHPRVLVEQARSLDEFGGRRFDLGLGAGWYEPEFDSAGIPFGTAGQRIERLRRVAGMLDGMLNPRAPLWVGGKGGPKLMDVIAEHADGWNVSWLMDPGTYEKTLDVLGEACARRRRDPATVTRSVGLYTLLGSDRADLERRFDRALAWAQGAGGGYGLDVLAERALYGTPGQCASRIKEFDALGVEQVILNLAPAPFSICDDEQLELAAAELLPKVR